LDQGAKEDAMAYVKGDRVMPMGYVPRAGQLGIVVGTIKPGRCLVQFEEDIQEEYDAGVLTLVRWGIEDFIQDGARRNRI